MNQHLIELLNSLRETPFFQDFGPSVIARLTKFLEIRTFQAGSHILVEGEPNSKLYFLVSGKAGVFVKGERVATLRRLGDVIGEMSLISSRPASATVTAEVETRVIVFDVTDLQKESKETFEALQKAQYHLFAAALAERLTETNEKARQFEILNQELERKVEERTAELRAQIAENRSLVRILCHDLNNTLSVVQLTTAQALRHPERPADGMMELWKRVQRASQKETELLSHVRQMIAIESGKTRLKLQPVSLRETIETARFLFQERLTAKNLRLEDNVADGIRVLAEPVTLSHSVLNNLVSNAIKFSDPGGVIAIEASRQGDRVELVVRDQGIGVPPDLLPHLFSPDHKTNRAGTSGEVGTGFGMPLVKTCLTAFGATIRVESVCRDAHPGRPSGTSMILSFQSA